MIKWILRIILLVGLLFHSCKNNYNPKSVLLDYSKGSGWGFSYSLKVYNDGMAYLNINSLKKSDSIWVKKDLNIKSLTSLIEKSKKLKLASKYEQPNVQDASFFYAILYNDDGKASNYYVYGDNYPQILGQIRKYCDSLKDGKGWNKIKDTIVTFESDAKINGFPKIIIDSVHFPPPIKH
jgi:hypothetical protein